ncbi:hypothetical protein EV127DRAFT_183136 [Xylaria flabelliformis]|nr:hypothetical protein EV127DRAFT_183136 [Xylaria flabelliformis]
MIANDLEVIRQATESYYSEVEGNAGETSLEKASACVEVALADAREHLSTIWYNESLAAWNRSLAEDPEQLGAPGGVFTSAESSKQFKLAHMHKKNTSMSLETLHATTWWDVLVCEDEDFRCRLPMAMLIFERGELLDTPCRAPPGKPGFFKVAAALQDEDGKAASECSTCYAFGQTPCRAYRLSHRHLNALSSNQATKASDNTGNAE